MNDLHAEGRLKNQTWKVAESIKLKLSHITKDYVLQV